MKSFVVLILCIVLCRGDINEPVNLTNVLDLESDKPNPTIIGGYAADFAEFPYAARLYIHEEPPTTTVVTCSGSAVADALVLTAAHCVAGSYIVFIVTGVADQTEYMKGKHLKRFARYRVVKTFVHPHYNQVDNSHDIALIKTGRPMLHTGHKVVPVVYEYLTTPADIAIFGWGVTETKAENDILYAKHMKVDLCNINISDPNSRKFYCLLGQGISHGDSGGGLVYNGKLYGVAAFFRIHNDTKDGPREVHYYTPLYGEDTFLKPIILANGTKYFSQSFGFFILTFLLFYLFYN